MVRVGVVVLLFGFAFLVKYAAARNLVPLEIRLAAAFATGIGMLISGWRLVPASGLLLPGALFRPQSSSC